MTKKYLFIAALISVIFISCSRDEPNPLNPVPPPPPPQNEVVMNEFYARGDTINPDWVEIYNNTASAVDISGFKIYDNGGMNNTKPKKELPAGTVIPANGFLVIVVDDTSASGFGLSTSGEKVWFENASGSIVDSVQIPALGVDTSYGRKPDGSNSFEKMTPPTKGTANGGGSTQVTIMMNEIYSRGSAANPDWIEIYNASDVQVDISAYKIYDSGGQTGGKPKKEFPNGTIIPAKGYFVIVTDDGTESGFGISSGGEKLWLDDNTGAIADSVTCTSMSETESYSRIPTGGVWQLSNTITRGTPNQP